MKISGKHHVTATEKRAIKSIISKKWTSGHTKIKSYFLTETDYGYEVAIKTKEVNDFGKRIIRNSTAYVHTTPA